MSDRDNETQFNDQLERLLGGEPDHGLDNDFAAFCTQLQAAKPVPDAQFTKHLQTTLEATYGGNENHMTPKRSRLKTRFVLILAAVLIGATAVYAIDSLLQRVIDMDAGLQYASDAELGTPLDLSQTADDLTVNLQWVYADQNRISVGYTISGDGPLDSPAFNYYPRDSVLTDETGYEFQTAGGMGHTGMGEPGSNVVSFDTSRLDDLPDMLNLHLTMNVEIMTQDAYATIEARPTPGPDSTPVVEQIKPGEFPFTGPFGPFEFDFGVSLAPGRIIELDQTVIDQEIAVTLKQADISASQTRLQVCFDPPSPQSGGWTIAPTSFTINGQDVQEIAPTSVGADPIEDTNCQDIIYNAGLNEHPGDWRLEITEVISFGDSGADQTRIAGSWVFDFVVE